jgi:hypothetical protein
LEIRHGGLPISIFYQNSVFNQQETFCLKKPGSRLGFESINSLDPDLDEVFDKHGYKRWKRAAEAARKILY